MLIGSWLMDRFKGFVSNATTNLESTKRYVYPCGRAKRSVVVVVVTVVVPLLTVFRRISVMSESFFLFFFEENVVSDVVSWDGKFSEGKTSGIFALGEEKADVQF
jgi:hypothetical protein